MNRLQTDQRGISLVELLISITIISVLSIVIMSFMTSWLEQYITTSTRATLLTQAQDTLDLINENVRLSSAADQNNRWQDANSPGAPANQFSWQSGSNTLLLASAVEDEGGTILFSDPANYISHKNNYVFFVQNGVLFRRTLAAPVANNSAQTTCPEAASSPTCPKDRKLAENVTSFTVRYLNAENAEVQPTDARSIELTLTLRKQAYRQTVESTDKMRMVFRND